MASRPRLLDLFCGAGGAAMGYYRAGFDVVGVDIKPQPHFPFEFHQADALAYPLEGFDAYHASPPCERYSRCTPREYRQNHPDHIAAIRRRLISTGKPYVIENVPDARRLLVNPLRLCGTMFGLPTQRHRYFETWPEIWALTVTCQHDKLPVVVTGTTRRKTGRLEYSAAACYAAMQIDWMTRLELDKAIPPAYTEYIGKYLLQAVQDGK
jgi:DNA (cytosine-5)-methyltransferase 1